MSSSKRVAVWRHNSLFGHARMMEANAENIVKAATTSPEAKATAKQIIKLARSLRLQLKDRIDQ